MVRNKTRRRLVLVLAVAVSLALTTQVASAQKVIVGEHVFADHHTAHPYAAGVTAIPTVTWQKAISHPGATYIAVHFGRFQLAAGDFVVVRSPDGVQRREYRGAGRHGLGTTPEGFFATHVKGDTAIVELYTAGGSSAYGVWIDKYGRGYNDAEIFDFWERGLGEKMGLAAPAGWDRSICTSDDTEEAKCYEATEPAAYDTARAVARLTINGNAHCTGWLVGNAGHVMTNEHCITSQTQLNNIDFDFMAEGATCATNCGSSLACGGVIEASGGTFITDDAALDYALVLPDTSTGTGTDLPGTYGFMRLRQTGAVLNERMYIVQHPAGWGKRFAMLSSYAEDVNLGGFAYVTSLNEAACSGGPGDIGYWADTQGGSSGSPVLGYSDNRVIALHHCRGNASCTTGNPGSDDRNRGVPIEAVIADLGADLPPGATCDPPSTPSNLAAAGAGDNQIDLAWDASSADGPAITYNVERAFGTCAALDGPFTTIATDVATNSYSDTSVSASVSYAYRVTAYIDATECLSAASGCSDASTTGICTRAPTFNGAVSADSSGAMTCGVDVTWDAATEHCGSGVVYNVLRAEIAEGGTMTPVATCLTGTSFQDFDVAFGTEYLYTVRAEDGSGNGTGLCNGGNEETNDVVVIGSPSGPDQESFADNLEAGSGNFTIAPGPNDPAGTSPWVLTSADSHSPTMSFFVAEEPNVKDEVVTLASAVVVPAGSVLEFFHNFDTESTYDGGVLEYSTDGGATWNDINDTTDRFLEGGYNSTLDSGFNNPLPNREAWSGNSQGWVPVRVDLTDFSGQSIQLRWRFGCDSSVAEMGWYVDDVRIFAGTSCVTGQLLFLDGFESGNTAAWDTTVP